MDLEFQHPTDIYTLATCRSNDAQDLVAVGGDHSVEVVQVTNSTCVRIASFHIGSRITAIAWSPRSISPATNEKWYLELTAAGVDFGLHVLTKSFSSPENIFSFGGGLSGHHGTINGMVFCGGWDEDTARYVATVSDDKMLMVWDLYPSIDIPSPFHSRSPSLDYALTPAPDSRPQPTAYPIPFPHPLDTICAHPGTSKEFLVSDCYGSAYLTDWRSDPDDNEDGSLRHSSLVELIEPQALAASSMGTSKQRTFSIDWRRDAIDIVGGVCGNKFALWDISKLRGGMPTVSGPTFPEGGSVFRWCPTYPEHFAIAAQSPARGATIRVHNCNFMQAPPTSFTIRPKPHFVHDFDFLLMTGIPRIAAAVGRSLLIFSIGVDS